MLAILMLGLPRKLFLWLFIPLCLIAPSVQGQVGEQRDLAARQALVGRWEASVGRVAFSLRFSEEGTWHLGEQSGRYEIEGNRLRLEQTDGTDQTYQFDLQDSFLILRGGDLVQDLRLAKAAPEEGALLGYYRWLTRFSIETAGERAYRILTILGIVLVSILFVNLLRVVSSFLIFSDFGPFRFIYQRHKSKTRTIHSVALNLIKYIIYFTALGHVLAELGINYATYFASLSVIGLAIGFGSQGLVQDIVTGFFLIFDGQFGVGDMVEISGQTGMVEEVGLRTTRIRNFMGQVVVVPNRNIALVGNYSKGAVRAHVDVALADDPRLPQAADLLRMAAREIHRQFPGIVLREPEDAGNLRLETGETFRRLVFDLWPQQHQALIEQQIVPRFRELLEREGLASPGQRIAVFYRMPEQQETTPWVRRFSQKRNKKERPPHPSSSEGGGPVI